MSIYVFHTNETTFVVALKKNTRALENFDTFKIFNELYFFKAGFIWKIFILEVNIFRGKTCYNFGMKFGRLIKLR